SFAGGPDVGFAGTKIKVARVGGISGCVDESENEVEGEVTFFTFNLNEVIEQKTNPQMKPGDVVYMFDYERAYISGNVKEVKSIPLKQNITLTQAIVEAGGILPSSKKSEITIIRNDPKSGDKKILVFNLNDINSQKIDDPILQPDDNIFVPKDGVKAATTGVIDAILKGIPNIFFRF
ncbi:MAG TPA: SLBB domain-containing protein, partial [Pyrinomonadaceae bacterium]|nr:SLBB domain-containing protein [Pyrinomonadaceae bacterium]